MESRDQNGHNEQGPSRKFLSHIVQIVCTLEKPSSPRKIGTCHLELESTS